MLRLSFVRNLGLLVLAVMGLPSRSSASTIITVPIGLAPGSQYRLVFITGTTYNAVSSSIGTYNTAVNAAADAVAALAALGTTWLDIGSTAAVSAINNIGTDAGIPIYDLAGDLMATDAGTGAGGLFGGRYITQLYTERGEASADGQLVWTGTNADGSTAAPYALGGPNGWSAAGELYRDITGAGEWMYAGLDNQGNARALYGISGVLTVPVSSVPEPATTGMVLAGGALMFCARRRIHRNRRATRPLC